jgi:Ni,Fe-hydrogenase III large subunit
MSLKWTWHPIRLWSRSTKPGEESCRIAFSPTGRQHFRYKVKDPSFHNWNGLSMSLRDTGISDFPLNNKSYNLSYCGFDL